MRMSVRNIFIVVSLISSLIYGMPSYLVKEVEEAECAIMNLPSKVNKEKLSKIQKKLQDCLKKLNACLQESYDKEVESKILILETDLEFLKECKDVLLGNESLNSKVAQKWIHSGYTFERYLMHFAQ